MWTKGEPITVLVDGGGVEHGWANGPVLTTGDGTFWSPLQDRVSYEYAVWAEREGFTWARGHGPEVEAALLLVRSGQGRR